MEYRHVLILSIFSTITLMDIFNTIEFINYIIICILISILKTSLFKFLFWISLKFLVWILFILYKDLFLNNSSHLRDKVIIPYQVLKIWLLSMYLSIVPGSKSIVVLSIDLVRFIGEFISLS